MRTGVKSTFINQLHGANFKGPLPVIDYEEAAVIIDVMGRIKAIGFPKGAKTFGDLRERFVSSILGTGRLVPQIHLPGDRYRRVSVKDQTRMRRSKSIKTKPSIVKAIDSPDVPRPENQALYETFLSVKDKKTALQQFLGEEVLQVNSTKSIVVSAVFEDEEDVTANDNSDVTPYKSNHEEQTQESFSIV